MDMCVRVRVYVYHGRSGYGICDDVSYFGTDVRSSSGRMARDSPLFLSHGITERQTFVSIRIRVQYVLYIHIHIYMYATEYDTHRSAYVSLTRAYTCLRSVIHARPAALCSP